MKKTKSRIAHIMRIAQSIDDGLIEAYHGGAELIEEFDPSYQKELGFHFGESKQQAGHRSEFGGQEGQVGRYNLRIKNPLILDDVLRWNVREVLAEMERKNYLSHKESSELFHEIMIESVSNAKESGENLSKSALKVLTSKLELMGYDGVKYNNSGEGGGAAWIAFRPNQIDFISKEL
jgi:hypothetical protein